MSEEEEWNGSEEEFGEDDFDDDAFGENEFAEDDEEIYSVPQDYVPKNFRLKSSFPFADCKLSTQQSNQPQSFSL